MLSSVDMLIEHRNVYATTLYMLQQSKGDDNKTKNNVNHNKNDINNNSWSINDNVKVF